MPYSDVNIPLETHLYYNPVTDRIEAAKPVQTTLNSFFLGEQHKMSSGGENVFFTNLTSDIDWYPMWGGVRDHEVVGNRDSTGVIAPSARVYNPYQEVEFYGPATAGAVDYAGTTSSALESASIFGIELVLAEPVNGTLTYRAYYGTDDTGNEVYKQERLTVGVAGDIVEWWFEHPLEVHPPTDVFSLITKADGSKLQVRPGTVPNTHHYVKLKGRTFADKDLEYISPYDLLTSMDFSEDIAGNHILFTDPDTSEALKPFFINELKAVDNGSGGIRVYIKDGLKTYINALDLTTTFISGSQVTQVLPTAINELNSLFSKTGTPTSSIPVITSSLALGITAGDSINYTVTGDYGSEVIWDLSATAGVVSKTGNNWNIMGGSLLSPGVYNVPIVLLNSNGQDAETLVITVSNPPYNNTKSILSEGGDYLAAQALTTNPLYRAANGTGASDAWTISLWFKGGTNGNSRQTIVSFGGNDGSNEGRVTLRWDNSNNDEKLTLLYGSDNNLLELSTPDASLLEEVWRHITVTYDGGTTGSSSGSVAAYYSRFGIWVDGVAQTLSGSESNYGFSGEIPDELFLVGEDASGGNHLRDCYISELALWSGDEGSNVASIYNSGSTHDLELLASPPVNYWRMGDGDTYPTIQDNIGSLDLTMFNMTASNIVNDVP